MAFEWLAPGVRRVRAPNPGLMTGPGTNSFLLGEREVAIIDPGPADVSHIEAILSAVGSGSLVGIWLTHAHPDHAAAVGELQRRTGAPLVAWPVPTPVYPLPDLPVPGLALNDGDELGVEGQIYKVIFTPGHSSDHVCFYRPADGLLFTGDVVAGQGTIVIAPPDGNLTHYLATLERLKALGSRILLPAHGEPISAPEAKFQEYIDHRLAREGQLVEALGRGLDRVELLVSDIYAHASALLHPIAAQQVQGHLLKLEGEGRVTHKNGLWRLN